MVSVENYRQEERTRPANNRAETKRLISSSKTQKITTTTTTKIVKRVSPTSSPSKPAKAPGDWRQEVGAECAPDIQMVAEYLDEAAHFEQQPRRFSPAAAERRPSRNKRQQQVAGQTRSQQLRQLQLQQQAAAAAAAQNDHHYDYYTDSDLTASQQLPPTTTTNGFQTSDHNYCDNILLFATEHGGGGRDLAQAHARAGQPARHYSAAATPTGKFVNYYPSCRQSRSPSAERRKNYAFHIPQQQQQQLQQASNYHPASYKMPKSTTIHNLSSSSGGAACGATRQQLYQARYGFVAPADKIGEQQQRRLLERPSLNQSFRSRTIAHIPSMVKLSTELAAPKQPGPATGGGLDAQLFNRTAGNNYEDFYEKPGVLAKQFVLSEADLLRTGANLVDIKRAYLPRDDGFDNPFKPETELSWEANLMVKLMKRGYPVNELPALVEAAKQIVLERQQEQQQEEIRLKTASRPLVRRQSISDIKSGRQVWADSLSRTISMPRFPSAAKGPPIGGADNDADSLDKLILRIENETNELIAANDSNQPHEQQPQGELIEKQQVKSKVAGARTAGPAKLTSRGQVLGSASERKASSSQPTATSKTTKRASGTNNSGGNTRIVKQAIAVGSAKMRANKSTNRNSRRENERADLRGNSRLRAKRGNRRGCCVIQ